MDGTALVLNGTIISDDQAHVDVLSRALRAAGCNVVSRMAGDEVARLVSVQVMKPDILVVLAPNMRLLNRLAAMDVPMVVVCAEKCIDSAFLAGATECVALPIRERELEGRIRHALRARNQQQFTQARERKLADMIADLQRARLGLEQQLCVDTLTDLATRRHALAMLDAEARRSGRDGTHLGLIMLDVDDLHAFNEQYGHGDGDRCLRDIANVMSACTRRPSDFISRYGGDEFLVVLPNTDLAGTRYVAESLRSAVEQLGIPHARSRIAPVVTVSAGLTSAPMTSGLTPEDAIHAAETALRHAKTSGRNQLCSTSEYEQETTEVTIGRATTTRADLVMMP